MTSTGQKIFITLVVAFVIDGLFYAHARPQQFSPPNWNQFPNSGNQWTGPNPQNPFFPSQQPQQPLFPPNNNAGGVVTSTTPAPTTATTASPAYLACLQRCGTTMEYNPVCGSDGINYFNNGRLSCAVQCGKSVIATRMGTCNPL